MTCLRPCLWSSANKKLLSRHEKLLIPDDWSLDFSSALVNLYLQQMKPPECTIQKLLFDWLTCIHVNCIHTQIHVTCYHLEHQ